MKSFSWTTKIVCAVIEIAIWVQHMFWKMVFKNLILLLLPLPLIASGAQRKGEVKNMRINPCLCTVLYFYTRTVGLVMHINSTIREELLAFFVFQDCFYSTLRNKVVDKKFLKKIFPYNCKGNIKWWLSSWWSTNTERRILFFCANIWLKLIKTRK